MSFLQQQIKVDLAFTRNQLLPDLQAVVVASQDVGRPALSKNDRAEFELEAGVFLDVPFQPRKSRGKLAAIQAKLGQIRAKTQMTEDKITAELKSVYADLSAAYRQIERARESVALADRMAKIDRPTFELGASDLLSVNLREQQAAQVQTMEVDALFDYFTAQAD